MLIGNLQRSFNRGLRLSFERIKPPRDTAIPVWAFLYFGVTLGLFNNQISFRLNKPIHNRDGIKMLGFAVRNLKFPEILATAQTLWSKLYGWERSFFKN